MSNHDSDRFVNENPFLDYYFQYDLDLIPLGPDAQGQCKAPIDLGWPTRPPMERSEAWRHCRTGNVGWRIGDEYFVLDVDPRNGGFESLVKLLREANLTMNDFVDHPQVSTGGEIAGQHIYFAKPPDWKPSIKNGKKEYPGLDILHGPGRQVVAMGSVTVNQYRPLNKYRPLPPPRPAPQPLIDFLSRKADEQPGLTPTNRHLQGIASPDEIKALLAAIDVHRFDDYEDWFAVAAAVRFSCDDGPTSREIFRNWSFGDEAHANDDCEKTINRIWGSIRNERDDLRTIMTLFHEVERDNPGVGFDDSEKAFLLIPRIQERIVKAELQAMPRSEVLDDLKALQARELEDDEGARKEFLARICQIEDEIDFSEACNIYYKNANPKGRYEQFFSAAKKKRKAYFDKKAEIEAKSKPVKHTLGQWVDIISKKILKAQFDGGKHLQLPPNKTLYHYDSAIGYWSEYHEEMIRKAATKIAEKNVDLFENKTIVVPNIATHVVSEIRSRVATNSTDLYRRDGVPSAINLNSSTVWIDRHTGALREKAHDYRDNFRMKLKIDYDDKAECPSFDTMLQQCFEHVPDNQKQPFLDHLWELIGYCIQPYKKPPTIMIWKGEGENGKSEIASFVQDLIGRDLVLTGNIQDFAAGKDSHELEGAERALMLVDDDIKAGTWLDDGVLKKFSESKPKRINPKHKPAYQADVNVTPLLISNNALDMRDVSIGMRRRLDVIYWETNIARHVNSVLPRRAREHEMPGILNRALGGLSRLRARGHFAPPPISISWRDRFLKTSNSAGRFVEEAIDLDPLAQSPLADLYQTYSRWCKASTERWRMSRDEFVAMLNQVETMIEDNHVYGAQLKPSAKADIWLGSSN